MNKLFTYAPTGARLLLGLIFTVFGLNKFFQFIPMPPMEGVAAEYMGGLAATGYFFPLLGATEVVVGVALLLNRFTALALVILAPITVHIAAFHILDPSGLPMAVVILLLHLGLAWDLRAAYRPLLQSK
ncbi:MAG: DoxX family membrane protein [Planctomycetes bacterium]|nr:DoxX family membrane protein [Planctomycetota bacterium]